MHRNFAIILTSLMIATVQGCHEKSCTPRNRVAVTNTFLAAAVNDVTNCGADVILLAGPGMCPGHFDIRPNQIDEMRSARILLRMDFQKSLDTRLKSLTDGGLEIFGIKISGGLCQPESYLSACQQIANCLVQREIITKEAAEKRLDEISKRISRVENENLLRVAKLENVAVVSSVHQSQFCRWLGLRVVAGYGGADTALPSHINEVVKEGCEGGVKIIVANAPEGRKVADSLAERLNAKVVMFDNFPADKKSPTAFDDLISKNVSALIEVFDGHSD